MQQGQRGEVLKDSMMGGAGGAILDKVTGGGHTEKHGMEGALGGAALGEYEKHEEKKREKEGL